jgi:hypothetical protein
VPPTYVISEGPGPTTEGSEGAVEVRLHVEDGHDNGDKGLDTLVNTSGQPGGPTSLGCTRHDEGLDARNLELISEVLNSVPRHERIRLGSIHE